LTLTAHEHGGEYRDTFGFGLALAVASVGTLMLGSRAGSRAAA
jgi:hypothetical protein